MAASRNRSSRKRLLSMVQHVSQPLVQHGRRWGTPSYWRQLGIVPSSASTTPETKPVTPSPLEAAAALHGWQAALARQQAPSLLSLVVGPRVRQGTHFQDAPHRS